MKAAEKVVCKHEPWTRYEPVLLELTFLIGGITFFSVPVAAKLMMLASRYGGSPMKTVKEIAAEIVHELREGKSDEYLMKKHGVSPDSLSRLKHALIERGLLNQQHRQDSKEQSGRKKKSIDAREFITSFRATPDDFHLMKKFELKPKQLKKIYDAMMSRGLLSEYEFHCRWIKAPELDEPTAKPPDSSTTVRLVENFSDDTLRMFRAQSVGQPRERFPAPSGNTRGRFSADEDAAERCPKCRRAKASHSPDVCVYCGIVFSKMSHSKKYEGVAIWDADAR